MHIYVLYYDNGKNVDIQICICDYVYKSVNTYICKYNIMCIYTHAYKMQRKISRVSAKALVRFISNW